MKINILNAVKSIFKNDKINTFCVKELKIKDNNYLCQKKIKDKKFQNYFIKKK